ncbi:hypothetical protein ACFRCG_39740 [Embleya sp. NPDC056575]|uniref:hypothetical protein n=1 Tax=unclassified Embleya TaxID=2699296 RepID=UPI0036B2E812
MTAADETSAAPLDLDAIRADQATATTSPVRPGGPTFEHLVAWNKALIRCIEQHVPALLALVAEQAATVERQRTTAVAIGPGLGALAADLAGRTAAEIQRRDEAEADPGRGMPSRGDWRLARDRTWAAEHEAERLEAELVEARAEIERLRAEREDPEPDPDCTTATVAGPRRYDPPLPTTEDYRVVLRDEADADSPTGGWQRVGSTEPTLDRAVEQMATRRWHHPEWAEMRVWRRQDVWSVAAVEDRDTEPLLCVAAHAVLGRICDRPGDHPGLHSGRSDSGEWAQW